jgi:hypothetical protein
MAAVIGNQSPLSHHVRSSESSPIDSDLSPVNAVDLWNDTPTPKAFLDKPFRRVCTTRPSQHHRTTGFPKISIGIIKNSRTFVRTFRWAATQKKMPPAETFEAVSEYSVEPIWSRSRTLIGTFKLNLGFARSYAYINPHDAETSARATVLES